MFQCPTSGFLLFYSRRVYLKAKEAEMFQCPTTGFLLFYKDKLIIVPKYDRRFNALPRAFFFSTHCCGWREG